MMPMNSPPAAEEAGPSSNMSPVAAAKQSLALPGRGDASERRSATSDECGGRDRGDDPASTPNRARLGAVATVSTPPSRSELFSPVVAPLVLGVTVGAPSPGAVAMR